MQRGRDKFQNTMPFGGYGHTIAGPASTYSGNGTLPSLPVRPPGYTSGYGVRMRPASGLAPTITNIPNLGAYPHMPTVPREKPSRLSSSDSKALEALRPSSRHQLSHIRRNTTDGARLKSERQTVPPILPRPPSSQPKTLPRTLPPLPPVTDEIREDPPMRESDSSENDSEDVSESESSLEEESEIFSDEVSEAPPSRPGFESDAERSAQVLSIPFPEVTDLSNPFPATIIQDYAHLDMEKYAASAHVTGMSQRVNNIVRAFRIHGPLDTELLSKALNEVASLHHVLKATFQRSKDRLYLQTSQEKASVNLESPVIGHETPQDLIINARRKIFTLPMKTDLCNNEGEGVIESMSLDSLGGNSDSPSTPDETKVILQKKKSVSFARIQSPTRNVAPLPALSHPPILETTAPEVLMRARLVRKKPQEHILVLSFPSIICDFWSSCLFMQQLVDAYSKLEKSAAYRPSVAATRIETKRQEVVKAYVRERGAVRKGLHSKDAASRLLQRRAQFQTQMTTYTPAFPACIQFQQVARRENQLLKMMSKEKLWAFWESMVTATIRRQRGPNRVKVVPPVRIPSGLGEKVIVRARPGTSRLRPLTARGRPQTAMKRQGSVFAEMGTTREALAGPKTLFHFVKIEEDVCASFRMSLPEEYLACINTEEVLSLMCLGAYVLMLGKCCRGWGAEDRMVRERGDGASGSRLNEDSFRIFPVIPQAPREQRRCAKDPLQQYLIGLRQPRPIVVPSSPLRRASRAVMGGHLDLGSFLLGLDISLRNCDPKMSQGLFGPLTNCVGIRVNLSSCPTFADLIIALGKTLQLARNHGHFPFSTIAEEVGLVRGLPIKFSFLHHRDIVQITNPDSFYFPETAVGVEGHGLARFGSTCYLTPLSTKMDDTCHFELLLWESYEGESVGGGFCYQPQSIRTELVEAFGSELCRLLVTVAEDPCRPLLELASLIRPPFLSSSRMRSRKH